MKEDYFELKQKIPIISQKFSEEVKLNFLNNFFQRGIRNKKLGKVKNLQVWVA